MIDIVDGGLRFASAPFQHRITVAWRSGGSWRPLKLERGGRADGAAFVAREGGLTVRLSLAPSADATESVPYTLSFQSPGEPTRVQLAIEIPDAPDGVDPFHQIPSFLFGDNNIAHVPPGTSASLTRLHPDTPGCASEWECRADRAAVPVSMALFAGGLAGVSIPPYSDAKPRAGDHSDTDFIRNGVFARLSGADGLRGACGVTVGYGNLPFTFLGPGKFLPNTAHFSHGAEARGVIYLRKAADRRAAHAVVRELYESHRERPRPPISCEQAARDLTRAFLEINWHGDDGFNAARTSSGVATPFFGGKPFRNNFTNMRCADEGKTRLVAWRTLPEVGWTGAGVIGYPMLRAGARFGDAVARQRGAYMLDAAADGINPKSGLLFDVSGVEEGKRLNWWWSAPPYMDCHCAYTNASGVYYLLKSHRFARESMGAAAPPSHATWAKTALSVLDAVIRLQMPDGHLGVTYSAERPEILDADGFAGAWWIPGLAYAYELTRDRRYLDAATKALARYHHDVRDLSCWGTPMDVGKMLDHEGNLGFLRGAILLSEVTKSREFLDAAVDGAGYEYLWRYGFRSRPQARPLRGSHWNSCGGSITSAGTSMHPMGVYVSSELHRLARATEDDYHARRADDGLDWAANTVSLWPEHTGYGARGVMTERYSPSDGALLETWPDGSPSSIWFSYNGWAAAASLEGLIENLSGDEGGA